MTACSVQPYPDKINPRGWKVFWREVVEGERKQRSRAFDTKSDAERWASHVRAAGVDDALRALAEAADREHIRTLSEALDAHLAELVVKPGTKDEYEKLARRTWLPTLGPLPVHIINKARIVAWVNHAHEVEGRSPKTITNAHGLLSGVLNTAATNGWIPANPCRGIRMPTGQKREKVWLTEEQGAAIIRAHPEYWQPFVTLIASTGMRLGEVTALQWQDINWSAHRVTISRGLHKVGGKYIISSTKTRRSTRTIKLPPVAVAALEVVRDRGGVGPGVTIFRGEGRGKRDGARQVWPAWYRENIWHPARRRAGIGVTTPDENGQVHDLLDHQGRRLPRATPHSLRDSHVAWLISRGQALPVIQARLGHESIKTTIDVYGHLQADVIEASVDAAQDALRSIER